MQKLGDIFASMKDHDFVDSFDVNSPGSLRDILVYKKGKHLGNFFLLATLFLFVIVVWKRPIFNFASGNTCSGFIS